MTSFRQSEIIIVLWGGVGLAEILFRSNVFSSKWRSSSKTKNFR